MTTFARMDPTKVPRQLLYSLYLLGPGSKRALESYAWVTWYRNSPEDIRKAARDELFRQLVRFAYDEVPFYRRLYDGHNVDLKGINGVEDIIKLPTVSRETIAAAPLKQLRPPRLRKLVHKVSTSGSSQAPLVFYRSLTEVTYSLGQLFSYLESWGLTAERRVYFLLPGVDPTISFNVPYRRRISILNRRHSLDSRRPVDAIIARIEAEKPQLIVSVPRLLQRLSDRYRETGRSYSDAILFAVTGEPLTAELEAELTEAFPACRTIAFYAAAETGIIAAQCSCSELFHVNPGGVILEVEDDGRPVLTNLRGRGTPFIRYSGIDDRLQAVQGETCECGGGGELIAEISRR